jgi:SAM-dependent methyltransferase
MEERVDIRTAVRERYGAIAEGKGGCCGSGSSGSGCCGTAGSAAGESSESCGGTMTSGLAELGYSAEEAAAIPEGANLGLGCGNPISLAEPKRGDTVLDLGSGAGVDAFLASREVGPEGRVIGVDMTPAMIDRARANAAKGGYTNVEFRLGEIEHLPLPDASVDVIVSNCVVNLSPEKDRVFREAFRVLKPGGRMLVSDLVLEQPLPKETRESIEAYVGCIAGASLKEDYLRLIREAGFQGVEIAREGRYGSEPVTSVQVRAVKP